MIKDRICLLYLKKYRHRAASCLLITLLGAFLLPSGLSAAAITPENIIRLTNQERESRGLAPLAIDDKLVLAAAEKGRAILEREIFAHDLDGRKFSAWVKEAGYRYSYVGENLALDFTTSEGALKAWMASPSHEKNILNPYFKEIGVAVLNGNFKNGQTTLIVQIFGAPTPASAGLAAPFDPDKIKYAANTHPEERYAAASEPLPERNSVQPEPVRVGHNALAEIDLSEIFMLSGDRLPGVILSSPALTGGNGRSLFGSAQAYSKFRLIAQNTLNYVVRLTTGFSGDSPDRRNSAILSLLVISLLFLFDRRYSQNGLAANLNKEAD